MPKWMLRSQTEARPTMSFGRVCGYRQLLGGCNPSGYADYYNPSQEEV